MSIVNCSMGTIQRSASSFLLDLLEIFANAHLDENRSMIISLRESASNLIHIENTKRLDKALAMVVTHIHAPYINPSTIKYMIYFIVQSLFISHSEKYENIEKWNGQIK